MANIDQILYEASLGWGKGCIRFRDRLESLDQNSGFHGNIKRPLTYNGENLFSVVSDPIVFILAGNEDIYKILGVRISARSDH